MTENESIKNIRKVYHLYTYINNYTLKEGKKDSRKYINRKNNRTDNGQGYMEIQLNEEEASRYDRNKIMLILKKIYRNNKEQKSVYDKRIIIVCYRTVYFWRRKWQ